MKTLALVLLLSPVTLWASTAEFAITIKDHQFEPAELHIPADQKIKLIINNTDSTPEEFESHALNREKMIGPGSKVTIYVGPLKPGSYSFVGEYHEETAKGTITVE